MRAGYIPGGRRVELLHELRLGLVPVRLWRQHVYLVRSWLVSDPPELDGVQLVRRWTVPGLFRADELLELPGGEVPGRYRSERVREV